MRCQLARQCFALATERPFLCRLRRTGLPLAWRTRTARLSEYESALPVLDDVLRKGFKPETLIADKGYDFGALYDACETRGIRPIVPLRATPAVKRGDHHAPECEHGRWTFAGADFKRGASKWRCPTGECQPRSTWIKASRLHTLVPRGTQRWRDLYRSRSAVEREFGRLKHEYGLARCASGAWSASSFTPT